MLDLYAQQVLALDPVGFWISALVALAAAFGITRHGLRSFWKLRLIVDTPTARIRSAAQGYVELTGIAHPHRELVAAPLTGTPCVWYRYEIEERRGSGRNASWVTVERGDAGTPFQIAGEPCRIEKRDVLLPGQPDQHAEIVHLCRVQQPFRRQRVGAHGVHTVGGHLGEVTRDQRRIVKFRAIRIGPERAVSDTAHIEFFGAGKQEFARRMRTRRNPFVSNR